MQTPLGSLRNLDLSDHEVCRRILELDKHQLVEGLVFESFFDQYLMSLPEVSAGTMHAVDVDTAVVRLSRRAAPGNNDLGAFVWARRKVAGLGCYIGALSAKMPAWLVKYGGCSGERPLLTRPVQGE